MSGDRRPRQARVTDQDLRALISRIDNLDRKADRIIQLLEAEPPRGPRASRHGERFYPGVGAISENPTPREPSPIQQAAIAHAEAQEQQ